jgi:adenine-specific DNA-methyltransferase
MTEYGKLKKLLSKLFQLRGADQDPGHYRIVVTRSQEIADFIENGLKAEPRASLQRDESDYSGLEVTKFEEDVFSHVYAFFRRYYNGSKLLAARPLKSQSRSNPCDGQNVSLHWENHDQYYVRTARNTRDHFIHKDLGGYLTRELDTYIKTKVIHLDDLTEAGSEWNVSRIKAIRGLARQVIAFLADAEEVQKRLWLKRKYVVETNYCVTLDRIPKHLYPAIAANNGQREEWVRLCAIDEISESPAYSTPLTLNFLNAHPFLMVDTRFFEEAFKEKLIGEMEDLSEACNGLIICGEASQALRLIQKSYRGRIDSIVIDPPYNTGSNGFAYKDRFRHSSWLTMMAGCLSCCTGLLRRDGLFAATIDDNELYHLGLLLNSVFGENNRSACAPWLSEPSRGKEKTGLRTGHEYVLIYHNGDPSAISQDERPTGRLKLYDKFGPYRKGRELRKWGGISSRRDRPNQWYALRTPDGNEVYPIKNDGSEGHWRWGKDNESVKAALADPELFHWERCSFDKGVTHLGKSERWVPFEKIRTTRKSVGWSTWLDSHGFNADGTRELKNLFGKKVFDTPKPTQLYKWIVSLHRNRNSHVLDFFAGSGTTAHAIIDLNRLDRGNRKYILVEIEDHFDRVLKPRIQKVVYSNDWKGGKPGSHASGVSHMFKYLRIEPYEDCLNNLEVKPSNTGEGAQEVVAQKSRGMLRHPFDGKTLHRSSFMDPIKILRPAPCEPALRRQVCHVGGAGTADVLETFNLLIGLSVSVVTPRRWFNATIQRDSSGTLTVEEGLREEAKGPWWFRSVIGTSLDGSGVLVIWRGLTGREEEDNLILNKWFALQGHVAEESRFQSVYVNGRNNLENLKKSGDMWQVRLIEEEFERLMWDYGKDDS